MEDIELPSDKVSFRLVEFKEQRKLLIVYSICKHILTWMRIAREICKGMLAKTCLTRISLLTKERGFIFQPLCLDLKMFRSFVKWLCLGFPKRRGIPRYVDGRRACGMASMKQIEHCMKELNLPMKSFFSRRLVRLLFGNTLKGS